MNQPRPRRDLDQVLPNLALAQLTHRRPELSLVLPVFNEEATIVAAVTGDDEDNLVVCQMAKHHFAVPRTIARVNNPKNEQLFRHLGVDEIISPTRMALASIEQDIPVHELLHLAQLKGGELGLLEAQITDESPAVGRAADHTWHHVKIEMVHDPERSANGDNYEHRGEHIGD